MRAQQSDKACGLQLTCGEIRRAALGVIRQCGAKRELLDELAVGVARAAQLGLRRRGLRRELCTNRRQARVSCMSSCRARRRANALGRKASGRAGKTRREGGQSSLGRHPCATGPRNASYSSF